MISLAAAMHVQPSGWSQPHPWRGCPGRRDDRCRRGVTARSVFFSAVSVAETTAGVPHAIRWKATMEEKLGRSEPLLPTLSHTALRDGCPLGDDLERVKPAKVINVRITSPAR